MNMQGDGFSDGMARAVAVGPPLPVEPKPKYSRLEDLARSVDRNLPEAESLRLMRIGYRDRHKLLTSPREYFYWNILLPKIAFSLVIQFFSAMVLLFFWLSAAQLFLTLYSHLYLKVGRSLYEDLIAGISFREATRPLTIISALLLSGAGTWYYVNNVKVPPPLFCTRDQKCNGFLRTVVLSGPTLLLFTSMAFLRPSFEHTALILSQTSETPETGAIVIVPSVNVDVSEVLWEVLMKVLVPVLYVVAVVTAANMVHFWKGDFFIGMLKGHISGSQTGLFHRLAASVAQLKMLLRGVFYENLLPLLIFPEKRFWFTVSGLSLVPLLIPGVADLFRMWIYYHFLAFAMYHLWTLNIFVVKSSLVRQHYFGKLEFVDCVALPATLKDLRKSSWCWDEYLELQFRSDFLERLKKDNHFLDDFFSIKLSAKDMDRLKQFVMFWMQPIREYIHTLQKTNILTAATVEPLDHKMAMLSWVTGRVVFLSKLYGGEDFQNDPFNQDFIGHDYASLVRPSSLILDHVRILAQLIVRAKPVDVRKYLSDSHCSIVEQLAALDVLLQAGEKDVGGGNNRLIQIPNLEPTIRFYLKSHRQLVHITHVHLTTLVDLLKESIPEMLFKEIPGVKSYVERLLALDETNGSKVY